jgi:hypothetical protein
MRFSEEIKSKAVGALVLCISVTSWAGAQENPPANVLERANGVLQAFASRHDLSTGIWQYQPPSGKEKGIWYLQTKSGSVAVTVEDDGERVVAVLDNGHLERMEARQHDAAKSLATVAEAWQAAELALGAAGLSGMRFEHVQVRKFPRTGQDQQENDLAGVDRLVFTCVQKIANYDGFVNEGAVGVDLIEGTPYELNVTTCYHFVPPVSMLSREDALGKLARCFAWERDRLRTGTGSDSTEYAWPGDDFARNHMKLAAEKGSGPCLGSDYAMGLARTCTVRLCWTLAHDKVLVAIDAENGEPVLSISTGTSGHNAGHSQGGKHTSSPSEMKVPRTSALGVKPSPQWAVRSGVAWISLAFAAVLFGGGIVVAKLLSAKRSIK